MIGEDDWALADRDAKVLIGCVLALQTLVLLSNMLCL